MCNLGGVILSFLERAGNFVQKQNDDLEARKEKFDRLSDRQLLDKAKHAGLKDSSVINILLRERGLK